MDGIADFCSEASKYFPGLESEVDQVMTSGQRSPEDAEDYSVPLHHVKNEMS